MTPTMSLSRAARIAIFPSCSNRIILLSTLDKMAILVLEQNDWLMTVTLTRSIVPEAPWQSRFQTLLSAACQVRCNFLFSKAQHRKCQGMLQISLQWPKDPQHLLFAPPQWWGHVIILPAKLCQSRLSLCQCPRLVKDNSRSFGGRLLLPSSRLQSGINSYWPFADCLENRWLFPESL